MSVVATAGGYPNHYLIDWAFLQSLFLGTVAKNQ